jgi:hydroxymethylbilane synthase
MNKAIRIGTRESQLAVWQATLVQQLLAKNNIDSDLVFIRSDGDTDLQTPLYEIGVQGIFTRSLDIALINNKIDVAVHSMKDVPTQLANGIVQAAVLKRASHKDIFVYKEGQDDILQHLGYDDGQWSPVNDTLHANTPSSIHHSPLTIATSSIRRMAQWLHRYPNTVVENLRGNVNTRLQKVKDNNWNGAIFAAAGLERINLRPKNAIDLDWMLPAPAQGAIMVVCRNADNFCLEASALLNDADTANSTIIERDFLSALLGGCSTPISALAEIKDNTIYFKGNILTPDGKQKVAIEKIIEYSQYNNAGKIFAEEILAAGGNKIIQQLSNAK